MRSSSNKLRAAERAGSSAPAAFTQDDEGGHTADAGHEPMRTCIGCMRRDLQHAMVRIAAVGAVLRPDDAVRRPGRGGYLHRSAECLARFERSRVREFRSLRRSIGIDERREITESIRSRLARSAQLE